MAETPGVPTPNYNARRRMAAVVIGGIAAFAVWHFALGPTATSRAQLDAVSTTADSTASLEVVQQEAIAQLARSGTLEGFVPSDPDVLVAAHGRDAVFSATMDGVCFAAGMVNGRPTPVVADPSGQSCQPKAIVEQSITMQTPGSSPTDKAQARTVDDLMTQAENALQSWNASDPAP